MQITFTDRKHTLCRSQSNITSIHKSSDIALTLHSIAMEISIRVLLHPPHFTGSEEHLLGSHDSLQVTAGLLAYLSLCQPIEAAPHCVSTQCASMTLRHLTV